MSLAEVENMAALQSFTLGGCGGVEEVIDVRTPAIIGRSYMDTKPCRYWVMPLKGRWRPPYPATEKWSSIVNPCLCKG